MATLRPHMHAACMVHMSRSSLMQLSRRWLFLLRSKYKALYAMHDRGGASSVDWQCAGTVWMREGSPDWAQSKRVGSSDLEQQWRGETDERETRRATRYHAPDQCQPHQHEAPGPRPIPNMIATPMGLFYFARSGTTLGSLRGYSDVCILISSFVGFYLALSPERVSVHSICPRHEPRQSCSPLVLPPGPLSDRSHPAPICHPQQ